MRTNRLSVALSATALVVAVFGATPVGSAAQSLTVAFAKNAAQVGGFKPSKTSKKNTVVVRGANGKIDQASLPVIRGERGEQGLQGLQGIPGPAGQNGQPGAPGPSGERGPEGPPNPNALNSDKLDSLDSLDFLRSNATAGGDLTGTYPNPTVGPDKITGAEVSPNSLSGADVDESSLSQVPSAANAANAANAAALGGFPASGYLRGKELNCISDIVEDGGPQCGEIFNEPGALRIVVQCDHDSSGSQGYRVWVRFSTNTNNAWIRAYGVDDNDFDVGEQPIQLQGTDDWRTAVYRSAAGVMVTVAYATWESSSTPNCALHGFALVG